MLGSTNHSCHFVAQRNKHPVDDFYSILDSTRRYTDKDFTPDDTALFWDDMGEKAEEVGFDEKKIVWKRAYDAFPSKTLFGDGISVNDVNQGNIGNCWFLAAASALAEYPGRMEKVFLNHDTALNSQGIYAVNLYTLGVPHTVVIDDYLPLTSQGNTLFAHPGKDNSLWVAILEKAFAKYYGNYYHIEGGFPEVAVRTMNGGPHEEYDNTEMSEDKLWRTLLDHDGRKDIITAGSPAGSDTETDD